MRRRQCLVAFVVAAAIRSSGVEAFTNPSTQHATLAGVASSRHRSGQHSVLRASKGVRDEEGNDENRPIEDWFNPFSEIARPLVTAATSAFLATSILFSTPLLPPPDAQAAATAPPSRTATSIEIDLRSVPALTRKAIVNRNELTEKLIESFKSFKPILDLLSESDTVAVSPPKDIKGAINQALTKGDAQFVVNGEAVDVRVESVPGVIVVRVINPNIPRLPFLKDGTAALQFVDGIVDVAPEGLEKAAEEVQAIEKFLMWGSPQTAPIQYKGSTLDYFLSSKFMYNGNTVSLGALGDLTNSEVVLLGVSLGVGGAYSASYAYYVSLKEEAEREAVEKKAKVAAKKKVKAAADAKAKADAKAAEAATKEKEEDEQRAKVESAYSKAAESTTEEEGEAAAPSTEDAAPKGRKRDAIKNIFRRKK